MRALLLSDLLLPLAHVAAAAVGAPAAAVDAPVVPGGVMAAPVGVTAALPAAGRGVTFAT
jgi:hypothetical protein